MFGGGGLGNSEEPLEGVHGRDGESRPDEYGMWVGTSDWDGGGIYGACSNTDEDREGDNDAAEGWIERVEGLGLSRLIGELVLLNVTRTVARRPGIAAAFPNCAEAEHFEDTELASSWDTCDSQSIPLETRAGSCAF